VRFCAAQHYAAVSFIPFRHSLARNWRTMLPYLPSHAFSYIFIMSVAFLLGAQAFAQKVKVEHDPSADFSRFKTFALVQGFPLPDYLLDLQMVGTIEHDLAAKGLSKVDPTVADLLVTYHAAGSSEINISSLHDPTYSTTGGRPMPGQTVWSTPSTIGSVGRLIKKGSLGVEIVDRERGQLVWAAVAQGTAKEKRSDRAKQLEKVLTKMFEQYPPSR
jgi:Domain of unknown function (DUF4136)